MQNGGCGAPVMPMKKWSVYVYICSDMPDDGLIDAALADVRYLREVGSSDAVGVVAQADLPVVPTKRYVFLPKSAQKSIEITELDRNVNTADPASIAGFFKWANEQAPAENIFFIMWGHGYGTDDWVPFPVEDPLGTKGRFFINADYVGFPDKNIIALPLSSAPVKDATSGVPDLGRAAYLPN